MLWRYAGIRFRAAGVDLAQIDHLPGRGSIDRGGGLRHDADCRPRLFFILACGWQRVGMFLVALGMNEDSPRQAEDRQLLERVGKGDQDAFAQLYDRLSGPLYALCLRMIGDSSEAEDVLQEACLVIWRKAETYDARLSSVFSWSVHLTRFKAIDHLRKRGRRMRVLSDENTDEGMGAEGISIERAEVAGGADTAIQNDEAAQARRVLTTLSAEERRDIEAAFFGGLTHQEISAQSGQPLGTVKARIRRGLLKLRDAMKGAR